MNAVKSFFDDTSLFRRIYIIDLFCCMISFVQVLGYVMLPFLFIWGLRLVYFNQRRYNTFFKMRFGIWIGAFMAFSLLAILFNFTLTALISVMMFLHVFICFFIFYGMHTEPDFNFKIFAKKNRSTERYCDFFIDKIYAVVPFLFSVCGMREK